MITLPNIGIIIFPSPRARAYLQAMMKSGYYPAYAVLIEKDYHPDIVVPESIKKWFFDIDKKEEETIKAMGIDYISVNAEDINDSSIYNAVKDIPQEIFIYTGGGIVKKELLSIKKLIHIHPGRVPDYRGSTCFYYSIINDGTIGMSAIFLSDEIDKGPILARKEFSVPKNVDIDFILDSFLRSQMLIEVLIKYANTGKFDSIRQSPNEGETYYIIHPVLKHIAILKVNNTGTKC